VNQSDLNQRQPYRESALGTGHLLLAGFGALLILMIALIWVSITNIKTHQAQLDQVVSDHMTKVGLSLTMRTHARGRTLSLMRLLLIDDPFGWDEELMQFRDHAARFIVARNSLLGMPLSRQEKDLLALQGRLTTQAVPIQQQIIALIEDERYEQAGNILTEQAIPAQNAVIKVVDRFDKLQRDSADHAREAASEYVARTQSLILLLGTVAVLLGSMIAIVVIRAVRQRGERDAYLATHDPLTDLPNRALLMDRLRQAIRLCDRQQGRLGLLFIDIDHFKQINDSHGHAVGDRALLEVCRRVRQQLRRSDTLARLSGDEFVVLLEQLQDAQAAQQTAQRVVAAFREPAQLGSLSLTLSVSLGIALYPDHGETEDELLSHGDTAMYRSKQDGRGRWALYESP
jgi:diguanylate cyclase (GGDEF)-like protein